MTEEIKYPDLSGATSLEIAKYAVSVLNERNAQDIKLLHVEAKTDLTEYFVICEGNSSTQVRALADEVEFKLEHCNLIRENTERDTDHQWIVLDFGCIMIHVFYYQARDFYKLDKLWSEATEVDISDIIYDK